MPINTKHKTYANMLSRWNLVRDVVRGQAAIKEAGTRYLPMLTGQKVNEYNAYKHRAVFFEGTKRTLQGMVGAVFRKDPTIQANKNTKDGWARKATSKKKSLTAMARHALKEILIAHRYGILVDLPENAGAGTDPFLSGYRAEDIVNWQFDEDANGMDRLSRVVLYEEYEEEDPNDPYAPEQKEQYRELFLDRDGKYTVRVHRKSREDKDEFDDVKTIEFRVRGRRLDYIPFVFITPDDDDESAVESPPLEPIANLNISHYLNSADLEHGRHFTGLPTAVACGFPKNTKLHIGSPVAWVTEEPNAKAEYLEFTGQGLGTLENALKEKQEQMAILGARMLESQKKQAEAAETHKMRHGGELSALASLASSVSDGMNTALAWVSKDFSPALGEVLIELNKDYNPIDMTPQQMTALLASLQGGAMSWHVFSYNLERGEMYPDGWDADKELKQIQKEMDLRGPSKPSNNEADGLDDDEEEESEEEG